MKKNLRKEIGIIMEMLDNISKEYKKYQGMLDYIKMAECTHQLLDIVFGKGKYTLPIDIEAILDFFEIEVREVNLKDEKNSQKRSNRIVGELSVQPQIFGSGKTKCIYIDSDTTLYTQRYALAHELGHYLINENRKIFNDEYCIMPLLPKEAEELVADAFAVSLLIPMKVFIKEFGVYINEEREKGQLPIGTEDWLQYLSTSARVSYHYVACGYQQLRCVALWMYQCWCCEKELICSGEILNEKNEEKQKILQDAKGKYPVLLDNLRETLSESVINTLYQ